MVALKLVPYFNFKWPPCKIASAVNSFTHTYEYKDQNKRQKCQDANNILIYQFIGFQPNRTKQKPFFRG